MYMQFYTPQSHFTFLIKKAINYAHIKREIMRVYHDEIKPVCTRDCEKTICYIYVYMKHCAGSNTLI